MRHAHPRTGSMLQSQNGNLHSPRVHDGNTEVGRDVGAVDPLVEAWM